MDPRFLQYYERELRYLRELGAEFAKEFPKVAGRLGLSEHECADPHVERLIEAFGFMAARVQLKLDAEFPKFTQQLLELLYPHYLAPTPSMAVVQCVPSARDGSLLDGFTIARDTVLRTRRTPREQTVCEYRTTRPVQLWPFEIEQVSYTSVLSDLSDMRLPSAARAKALLRIGLRTFGGVRFDQLAVTSLPLFLSGDDEVANRLYEQLISGSCGVVVRALGAPGPARWAAADPRVRPLGFEPDEAMLPYGTRSFQGYRLLHEYFAFPSRFAFVEISGLSEGVRRCASDRIEILVALAQCDSALEAEVGDGRLVPFAAPAVNLFPHSCDRAVLSERSYELHVVPDRTRPIDLEVHSVTRVLGFGGRGDPEREFFPMYGTSAGRATHTRPSYYTLSRRSRTRSTLPLSARTHYVGSEVFLTLVDGDQGSHGGDLRQLAVSALCTNRDLPLLLALGQGGNDFALQTAAPVEAVRCIAGPSAPRASPIDGQIAWRLINQLSLNYLSLCGEDREAGAEPLRDMLGLYASLGDPALRRQTAGLTGVSARSVIRPLPGAGALSFGRGIEIALSCDERAFAGGSVFAFASVLAHFFAKYAAINSFTETVLSTRERGEVYRWPTTVGLRHTL